MVFTLAEVEAILVQLTGTHLLVIGLLYGTGMRSSECPRLRVKDLDFAYRQITVRDGKGVRSKGGEVGEAKLEKTLNPGQSGVLTVTFQEPGTYEMYCPLIGHRMAVMKGEVVIK